MNDVSKKKKREQAEEPEAVVEQVPEPAVEAAPEPEKIVVEVSGVQIDVTPAQKIVPGKRYTFTQWAVRRAKKPHHQPGLRAFVKNPNKARTIEEWDKLFEKY